MRGLLPGFTWAGSVLAIWLSALSFAQSTLLQRALDDQITFEDASPGPHWFGLEDRAHLAAFYVALHPLRSAALDAELARVPHGPAYPMTLYTATAAYRSAGRQDAARKTCADWRRVAPRRPEWTALCGAVTETVR